MSRPTSGRQPGFTRFRQEASALGKSLRTVLASLPAALGEIAALSPIALGVALLALACWWYEHDAHLRQAGALGELKKQTEANISQLQAQASAAVRQANQEHAQQMAQLEIERQKSERDAAALRRRLGALQADQQARLAQVAALPIPELANRLAARLGLDAGDLKTGAGTPESGSGSGSGAELSAGALRKVDSALVELDGCRQQAEVRDSLLGNCREQAALSAAEIRDQQAALSKLNEALGDKDKVLARSAQEHQAELKLARGTFTQRLLHALEHVALGVAIGAALAH
jgi:hypothetical protein